MFYVYLLHSAKDNGFYIGFSTDLKKRLSEHRRGASFATKSRGPWKLIYYEAYTEREDAEGRERFLKSGAGRRFETRSFPTPPRCFPRSFTFYVAHPVRSILARSIAPLPQTLSA
jgi:putative endonuclease